MKRNRGAYRSELEGEVILQGGDPDRISDQRADDYYYDDVNVFDAARVEIRCQLARRAAAAAHRMEREAMEQAEREYYEEQRQAEDE